MVSCNKHCNAQMQLHKVRTNANNLNSKMMAEERARKSSLWTTLTEPLLFHSFSRSHVWWKDMMIWPENDWFWFHIHFSSKEPCPLINSNNMALVPATVILYNHTELVFNRFNTMPGQHQSHTVPVESQPLVTTTRQIKSTKIEPCGHGMLWKLLSRDYLT